MGCNSFMLLLGHEFFGRYREQKFVYNRENKIQK